MGDSRRSRRGTLAGQIIEGHELVGVLATGGMGEVYLARHLRLGMQRAIKVIRRSERNDVIAAHRFEQEALTLSRLQHNSIVQVIDFGELPDGAAFLVMEYVEGPNLDQLVEGLGPLSLADALLVLEQIATALAYAHDRQVIHRDLKPANVLVRVGDIRQVKLIDFGLALTLTHGGSRLTEEGQILGSPLYLAPEQADGNLDVTPAVDAYGVGGVAYTLLSGKPPFTGLALIPLLAAHATETPPRLSSRCGVPKALDELLFRCLAKEPAERPLVAELAAQFARMARTATDAVPGGSVGYAETIQIASPKRLATMHQPPPTADLRVSSSLELLVSQPNHGDDEHREALLNQLLAVVNELAVALSVQDSSLGRLLRATETISAQLTDLEMELAVLDSQLEAPANAERTSLEARRGELAAAVTKMRAQATACQRQLVAKVDGLRGVADGVSESLFREVDDVALRLRGASTVASSS